MVYANKPMARDHGLVLGSFVTLLGLLGPLL